MDELTHLTPSLLIEAFYLLVYIPILEYTRTQITGVIMQSYASAFEIVTEDKAEIEIMKIRSSLMNELVDLMNGFGLTQVEAAKIIGCTQPRISQLKNGRLSEFSLTWLTKAKLKLQG